MSTRYNTGNPIESTDLRDMSDNAKNFDEFGNSTENSFIDRLGVTRKTIHGMNAKFDSSQASMNAKFESHILSMGFTRVGTFAAGATLTNTRQTLLWDVADGGDGQEYGWSGTFSKIVPPGSTPNTTGGIAVGAWMSRLDPELRISVREALRRSYAEAGYNLVAGSFEAGGTLVNANDVLLQESTGKAFSGPAGVVSTGTDPTSGGFVDKSSAIRVPVTYAGIRAYSGQSMELRCVGRQTVFDHGFGNFVRDDADTTSTDNGGTVLIDALGRRWKRVFIGAADVRWWGVVGDGVTSDSVALGKAISSYKSLAAWPDARILLTKTFDDGSPVAQQYQSYAIRPTTECTIDLAGGAIVRAAVGGGDAIDMYKSFIVNTAVKFRIENGTIDMNNHNGRFALFNKALPDSGIYNCVFINTRNNGVPRTMLPNSGEIVVIREGEQVYCDDCKFYVGSNGDLSGNAAPSYDNPSFGVRITTEFVTNEAAQTESTVNCAVRRCEFWGPFTWQPVEIAGTGTRSCYMKTILMYKPILSMVDLDKGCKRCYAEDIEIRFPRPGIAGTPNGGDGFAPIRFQGYNVGSDVVYAEDCWADNINIYGLPYSPSTPSSEVLGVLVVSSDAVNCKATNITVHGDGIIRNFLGAGPNSNLVLERISARAARLTQSPSPSATLNDCNVSLTEEGLIVSPAYLYRNDVKISINGGVYKYIGSGSPSFFQGYEQTLGQPSIEVFGAVGLGWNSFVRGTGATQLNNVRFVGNNSKQKIADLYNTIPAGNRAGNNSVLF